MSLPRLPVVVLAAHPDDETLGAGGLIHTAAAAGERVEVVVASDGEASHPGSGTHTGAHLAALRRDELREAVTRLTTALPNTAQLTCLGLPDGRLDTCHAELVSALAVRVRGSALIVTPWSGDGHPDHVACAAAGADVAARHGDHRHWQYPIWAWHWADPESSPLGTLAGRLDLDDGAVAAKRAALACHVSQHRPLSDLPGDEAILPPQVLSHFRRGFETFVLDRHPAATPEYFDALYGLRDDPWGIGERYYEVRKRRLLRDALPRPRYRSAFEPGCAGGHLTAELAQRCDRVLAWDGAARAVHLARDRLRAHGDRVRVEQRRIPQDWPLGVFDLIVLSEVGYYCADLSALAAHIDDTLAPDGELVACHWRHPAPDQPHMAERVHAAVGARLRPVVHHVEEDFLLDVWSRTGTSVARRTGVVR